MPFDHFKLIARFYDRAGQFELSEPLIGLLSLSRDCRLLDAGGGTGRVAMVLRPLVQDLVIVDTSQGMLHQAADKGLKAVCAKVEQLPFAPESFERILMVDALHHVEDQRLTALTLWKALTPGGRIVIVEPDIDKLAVKAIALGEKVLLMRSHFLDGEQMRSLFNQADATFTVIYDRSSTFLTVEKAVLQ